MDSDKILVMNTGQAVEFGTPYELLQNKDGYLSKMVRETGSVMETKLKRVAKEKFISQTESNECKYENKIDESSTLPAPNDRGTNNISAKSDASKDEENK